MKSLLIYLLRACSSTWFVKGEVLGENVKDHVFLVFLVLLWELKFQRRKPKFSNACMLVWKSRPQQIFFEIMMHIATILCS